jgi:hypothetical protein
MEVSWLRSCMQTCSSLCWDTSAAWMLKTDTVRARHCQADAVRCACCQKRDVEWGCARVVLRSLLVFSLLGSQHTMITFSIVSVVTLCGCNTLVLSKTARWLLC